MHDKKILTINGARYEYALSGIEGPNIIFINGFRMPLSGWERLFPGIDQLGRILIYNRPGIGKSSKAVVPQSGKMIIDSLAEILQRLNLSPPYILVAHSIGGLYANLMARLNPEQIAAVVFVDAAHPDEQALQSQYRAPALLRMMNETVKSIERRFDRFKYSEDECMAETIQQIAEAGAFPSIPVAVVSGNKKMPLVPAESLAIHLQCQARLLALTPHSRQYIATNSGHFPQLTEPEIVLNAIRETLAKI